MIVSKPKPNRSRRAIELALVVIVLTVFAGLLWPFPFDDKSSAKRTSCLSNVKQIALGLHIYASDNDESLPMSYTFEGRSSVTKFIAALLPYVKAEKVFLCINDESPVKRDNYVLSAEGIPSVMSYVHCQSLQGVIPGYTKGRRSLNIARDIADPNLVPYLRDPIRGFGAAKDRRGNHYEGIFWSPDDQGFAIAYLDGHATRKVPFDIGSDL